MKKACVRCMHRPVLRHSPCLHPFQTLISFSCLRSFHRPSPFFLFPFILNILIYVQSLAALTAHLLSPFLDHLHHHCWKSQINPFDMHHLVSGINCRQFRSMSLVLVFLPHLAHVRSSLLIHQSHCPSLSHSCFSYPSHLRLLSSFLTTFID